MEVGEIPNRRTKLTSRILLTPSTITAGTYLSLGDNNNLKRVPNQQRSGPITVWDYGFRREADDVLDQIGDKFEVDLLEQHREPLKLMGLATHNADVTQALVAAPSGTATFNGITQGRWYDLGKYDVNTVVVTVSAATKVVDVDYELDARAGLIRIIPGGTIADAANVSVTFGCAAQVRESFSYLTVPRVYGSVRIITYDQHDTDPVDDITFQAVWWIMDWGQMVGSPQNTPPKLCIMARNKITHLARK